MVSDTKNAVKDTLISFQNVFPFLQVFLFKFPILNTQLKFCILGAITLTPSY